MSRLFHTSFALLAAFCVPGVIPTASGAEPARSNQVFVKIIWPTDPQPDLQVETWIATKLKELRRTKFVAATPWVAVVGQKNKRATVWDGMMGNVQCGCPVVGEIVERNKGRVKVQLVGWSPAGGQVKVTLKDEPGCCKIAPVEDANPGRQEGLVYVAVLIGPPSKSIDVALIKNKASVTFNQKLVLDFKRDGDRFQPNLLKETDANKDFVRIKLAETKASPGPPPREGAKRPFLSVENGFGKTLQFRAVVRLKGSKEYFEIDDLEPIPAGETYNKCWGFDDHVEEVVVYQFKLSDKFIK